MARIVVVVGAIASQGLMFLAAHPPMMLRLMYITWVLLPFVALLVADRRSSRWTARARTAVRGLMLIIPLVSVTLYVLVVYPVTSFGLLHARPAAVFLLVPFASLLLAAIVVSISNSTTNRGASL